MDNCTQDSIKNEYDRAFGQTVVPPTSSMASFAGAVDYSQRFEHRRKRKSSNMLRIKKSQLVELKVFGVATTGNTGTRFQFQDQPYLRFKSIVGIDTYNNSDVPTSPTGASVITPAQLITGFLTLYINDVDNPSSVGEWMQNIPLVMMHRVGSPTTSNVFVFDPMLMAGQTIIWDKSYVTLSTPLANTTDKSFLFNVYFQG